MGPQAGWGGISGNHQGRANIFSRLMATHIWWPPVSACWQRGGLKKEIMDSASTSVYEKAASPSSEARQFSSSLYIAGTFLATALVSEL